MNWNSMQVHERGQNLITLFRQSGILQFKAVKCAITFTEVMLSMLPFSDENAHQIRYWEDVRNWLNEEDYQD